MDKTEILQRTHCGLIIYSHILQQFYTDEVLLHLSGNNCKTARNPFLGGSETLNIFNQDGIFLYKDSDNPDFTGDPFDFANHYYNLSEEELLKRIIEDLQLVKKSGFTRLSEKKAADKIPEPFPEQRMIIPKFSFFSRPVSNTVPSKEINLIDTYTIIKSNEYKTNTIRLREIGEKAEARKFKAANFDYVTFSGIFLKRCDNGLLKHSGLITIDFDHLANWEELKQQLLHDQFFETELLFCSPSGDGLKWIILIDLTQGSHLDNFRAIANYISQVYHLEVDSSGKDVSRACFLPYDPNCYINPKYLNQ